MPSSALSQGIRPKILTHALQQFEAYSITSSARANSSGETERFGDRQIDDEIELGGLLDRDVTRLGSSQDLVDKIRRVAKHIYEVCSIGHQASRFDKFPKASNICHPDCFRDSCRSRSQRFSRVTGATGGQRYWPSNQGIDIATKRLEFLREIVPGLRRL